MIGIELSTMHIIIRRSLHNESKYRIKDTVPHRIRCNTQKPRLFYTLLPTRHTEELRSFIKKQSRIIKTFSVRIGNQSTFVISASIMTNSKVTVLTIKTVKLKKQ